MNKLKLTLMHKLGAGYLLVAVSLIICAMVGYSASVSLSSSINHISQNAWDAAGGAMEGTKEIEAEALTLDRVLLNVISVEEGRQLIREASERGTAALARMESSGLIETSEIEALHSSLSDFRQQRDSVMKLFGELNSNKKKADQNMAEFDALLSDMAEVAEVALGSSNRSSVTFGELRSLSILVNEIMQARLGLLTRGQAFNLVLAGSDRDEQQAAMKAGLEQARNKISSIFESSYRNAKTSSGDTYQQVISNMLASHEAAYTQAVNSYFEFAEQKSDLHKKIARLLGQIAAIEDSGDTKIQVIVDGISDKTSFAEISIAASVAFGLLLAVVSFFFSNRAIVKPINNIAERLTQMGDEGGDLTQRLEVNGHDEIAKLSAGFNGFIDKIGQIIGTVKSSSDQVSSFAGELSTITALASQGASQQSSENSAIATAVEEMSASAEQIAESAASAARETNNADTSAQKGKKVVSQSIDGIQTLSNEVSEAAVVINNLEQKADSIGSVLDVIRSIAEQTNLLALNAAIEAARAGEQGRGFAVVADEVRTLASRTQQSTEEIQSMIEGLQSGTKRAVSEMEKSCNQAQNTVQMAHEAGQSLDEIVAAVTQINSTNSQIANAAGEQKKTASEVSLNVLAIQSVSEQTAENSLQAQGASTEMAQQAELLKGLIQQFYT